MTTEDRVRRIVDEAAGAGGLSGLGRLSSAICAMESERSALIVQLRRGQQATWEEIGRACGMTRQGATRRWSKQVDAASFGAAAEAYHRGRPGYPRALVDSMIPRGARRVLDLGAGTGKLTTLLAEMGLEVVAVEPDAALREQLAMRVPTAAVRDGSAEHIPLGDASVDAVIVAQAWHWFDTDEATREIARVLVPGGTLSVVRNIRDESEPWAAELGARMHRHTSQDIDTAPVPGAPFGDPERLEIRWQHTTTHAGILDMVASRSYIIALPDPERVALLEDVRQLLSTHPDLANREEIAMPYITRCTRVRLA